MTSYEKLALSEGKLSNTSGHWNKVTNALLFCGWLLHIPLMCHQWEGKLGVMNFHSYNYEDHASAVRDRWHARMILRSVLAISSGVWYLVFVLLTLAWIQWLVTKWPWIFTTFLSRLPSFCGHERAIEGSGKEEIVGSNLLPSIFSWESFVLLTELFNSILKAGNFHQRTLVHCLLVLQLRRAGGQIDCIDWCLFYARILAQSFLPIINHALVFSWC